MKKLLFLLPLLFLFACIQVPPTNDNPNNDTIVDQNITPLVIDTIPLVIDTIFKVAEVMPIFNGNLIEYLILNVNYPDSAKINDVEGVVYVSFVVAHTGDVVQEAILRSSGNSYLDEEACRVVEEMSKWKPGTQNNKPVSVFYVIPIKFNLQ